MKTVLDILSDNVTVLRTPYPIGIHAHIHIYGDVKHAVGSSNFAIAEGLKLRRITLSCYTDEAITAVEALIPEAV